MSFERSTQTQTVSPVHAFPARISLEPHYWHCHFFSLIQSISDSRRWGGLAPASVTVNAQLFPSVYGWPPSLVLLRCLNWNFPRSAGEKIGSILGKIARWIRSCCVSTDLPTDFQLHLIQVYALIRMWILPFWPWKLSTGNEWAAAAAGRQTAATRAPDKRLLLYASIIEAKFTCQIQFLIEDFWFFFVFQFFATDSNNTYIYNEVVRSYISWTLIWSGRT